MALVSGKAGKEAADEIVLNIYQAKILSGGFN